MKVSKCCGAEFYDQAHNNFGGGYSPNLVCGSCGERSEPIEQDLPSIVVLELPEEEEWREPIIFKKEKINHD